VAACCYSLQLALCMAPPGRAGGVALQTLGRNHSWHRAQRCWKLCAPVFAVLRDQPAAPQQAGPGAVPKSPSSLLAVVVAPRMR
jgi:hypothetical protein